MAVSVIETIKSRANAGNTAYIVVVKLLCDDYSDLPTQSGLSGYELAQGCIAHVINENKDYMIDSSGNWHVYGGDSWTNVYTKSETDALLDDKQDELTTAQLNAVNSGITAAKLTTDEAAIVELVDAGAKNLLSYDLSILTSANQSFTWTSNAAKLNRVTFTLNADKTISVSTESQGAAGTTIFYLTLDSAKISYNGCMLSGCPSGGSNTSYEIRTATPVKSDYGNGIEITSNTATNIAIIVRSGQILTNLLFKPMICTAEDWEISQAYQPYRPSWQEMYEMIQALQ